MNHWLIDTIRDVAAGRARPVSLWAVLCAVIGHDDIHPVPGLAQCRRCWLNAPYGNAPRGWVP